MNSIALFLAQLSAGQAAPDQNGSGTAGETGLQNFKFWSSVLASLDGKETVDAPFKTSLATVSADDVLPEIQPDAKKDGNETADILLFRKNAEIDLSKRIQIAEKFIDRLSIKQAELPQTEETQVTFEQLNRQIDLLRQQVKILKEAETNDSPVPVAALILSGYSPTQITEIQKSVEDLEAKLGRPVTLQDIISGVGNVLPEPEYKQEFVTGAETEAQSPTAVPAQTTEASDVNKAGIATQTKTESTAAVVEEIPAGNEDEEKPVTCGIEPEHGHGNPLPDFSCRVVEAVKDHNAAKKNGEEAVPVLTIIQAILKPEKQNGLQPVTTEEQETADTINVTDESKTETAAVDTPAPAPVHTDMKSEDVLAAALNTITPGDGTTTPTEDGTEYRPAPEQSSSPRDILSERGEKIARQQSSAGTGTAVNNQRPDAPTPPSTGLQNGVAVPQTFASFDDALFFSSGEQTAFNIHSGLPFSNTSQAAHMITQAQQQAGQPHPATEMVSARLQQAGQNGQNQVMTIHMDPEELGRVEVELTFGKDKTVKAKMLIEKPETYFMMQRDSATLERALQNSGLEIDGGGIDFELAEDGSAFGHNNEGNGGGEKYGGSGSDADADTIIETTMTWHVDPDSGHTRYSILA